MSQTSKYELGLELSKMASSIYNDLISGAAWAEKALQLFKRDEQNKDAYGAIQSAIAGLRSAQSTLGARNAILTAVEKAEEAV